MPLKELINELLEWILHGELLCLATCEKLSHESGHFTFLNGAITVEIELSEPFVVGDDCRCCLVVFVEEVLQEHKCFSFVEPTTPINVVLIPDVLDHLSNRSIERVTHELFEESSHLVSRDDAIAIEVILLEKSIELRNGRWCLVVVLQKVL